MKIGILVPMAEEIKLYQEQMAQDHKVTVAGIPFLVGKINELEFVLAQSGIGKVQAAMTATLLIDHFKVAALINTGSAAGIGAGLKIGDLVLGTGLAYHDVDVTLGGDYELGQVPHQPRIFMTDSQLNQAILKTAEDQQLAIREGLIVSGDQFIGSDQRVQEILTYFPKAEAIEMESAAVAQVARQFKIPVAVIRAISDNGHDDAGMSFDEFVVQAGHTAAHLLLAALAKLAIKE